MRDMTPPTPDPEHKTVMRVYAAIVASVILQAMPMMVAQGIGTLILFGAWVATYIVRWRALPDGLARNHMTWLSRTLWISSLLLTIGIVLAGLWVLREGDHSAIDRLSEGLLSGAPPSEASAIAAGREYFLTNYRLILKASLLTMGPGFAYFFYRVLRGFMRAGRGYRMANPKSWL